MLFWNDLAEGGGPFDSLEYWDCFHPKVRSSFQQIMGQWLDKQVKTGTVKVLSTNEELESLK